MGTPTLFPGPTGPEARLFSAKLCCLLPIKEYGDFLEPVFPQISGDTRAAVSMETFPANLGKEELGSRPRPHPHRPHTALLQPAGGPQVENNPPPPDFLSRGSTSSMREGSWFCLRAQAEIWGP